MKTQRFGVEIELTGITRRDAAKLIADYFGTTSTYEGTGYNIGKYHTKLRKLDILNVKIVN